MESGKLGEDRAPAPVAEGDLPLQLRPQGVTGAARSGRWRRFAVGVGIIALLLGGVVLWSLRPRPPAEQLAAAPSAIAASVAALGRLEPVGGVVDVTPPVPSRDAVVHELMVRQGSTVKAGDVLAVMETRAGAEAALGEARAEVGLRKAGLARARRTLEANKAEAQAQIDVARAQLTGAEQALARGVRLADGSTLSPARLEELQTDRDVKAAELAQAEARLVELAGNIDTHPDMLSAQAELEAARAALLRAETDVENTLVRAPLPGRIISVAVTVGEPSPSDGMMRLAVDGPSRAVLEVHQDRIHQVRVGAPVTLRAAAFDGELQGQVAEIGVEVQRQAVFDADPAANADARVFEVRAILDERSSAIARNLINLQVLASIETGAAP